MDQIHDSKYDSIGFVYFFVLCCTKNYVRFINNKFISAKRVKPLNNRKASSKLLIESRQLHI